MICYGSPSKLIPFINHFTLTVDWKTSGQFGHRVCEDHSMKLRYRGAQVSGNLGLPRDYHIVITWEVGRSGSSYISINRQNKENTYNDSRFYLALTLYSLNKYELNS